jgi:hypothetical protein
MRRAEEARGFEDRKKLEKEANDIHKLARLVAELLTNEKMTKFARAIPEGEDVLGHDGHNGLVTHGGIRQAEGLRRLSPLLPRAINQRSTGDRWANFFIQPSQLSRWDVRSDRSQKNGEVHKSRTLSIWMESRISCAAAQVHWSGPWATHHRSRTDRHAWFNLPCGACSVKQ